MKKLFIKIILPSVLFIVSAPAWAEENNAIHFEVKSQTGRASLAGCGNHAYSSGMGNNYSFTFSPNSVISNPRKLKYNCSISVPDLPEKEAAVILPQAFDLSKPYSEVQLTVLHIDRKSRCGPLPKNKPRALLVFSLSVDQKVIEERKALCLF